MVLISTLLREVIVLIAFCCAGLWLGIFVDACYTYGFIDGDPYEYFRQTRRIKCLFFYALFWIVVLGYSVLKLHIKISLIGLIVIAVLFWIGFFLGKLVNYIYRMEYEFMGQWYTSIILYILHITNVSILFCIITYLIVY